MKIYKYPKRENWLELSKRPVIEKGTLDNIVETILNEVSHNKD